MSQDKYQLYPGTSWEQIYSAHYRAAIVTSQKMRPIVPQDIPIVPESHLLAVYAASDTALDHWTAAGSFQQIYPSATFSNQKLLAGRYRLFLNQTTLLELPNRGASYQLRYFIPRWFEDIKITIWQYSGPISNTLAEAIAQLRRQIAALGPGGGVSQGNGPDGSGGGLTGSASFDNLDGGIG